MLRSKALLGIAIVSLLWLNACVRVGEFQEETRNFPLENHSAAAVFLKMGTGELRIQAGARVLLEGIFSFNVEEWRPEFEHITRGDTVQLTVRQGDVSGIPMGKSKNRWDIYLNEKLPLDLEVDFGAGEGRLDLRGLNLRSLEIDMGIGDLTVDLSGEHDQDLHVIIDGGVGSATVYLPEDIGVKVYVDKGIGSVDARGFTKRGDVYTNDAYEDSEITLSVDIDTGIGSIDLKLKGRSPVPAR
ncbi:MAG: toast rack family protein [Candidatus Aminicenantaceae bacterium]